MKVITLASQKGGCGKSSLAISCAVLAARNAQRVLLIDADPQRTAIQWCTDRNGSPPEVREIPGADLEKRLSLIARERFDFVIIDTPGQDHSLVATAIRNSAFTLIPCRPTTPDIQAMTATSTVARNFKRPYAFVLEQVLPTRGTRADEAAAALAEMGAVAPIRISHRIAWQDAYTAGQGISEYEPKGPAARELEALWRWLNARLKGSHNGQTTKD